MEKLADAVVYILLDKKQVLMEKRPQTAEYPEADIFPGGKVENCDSNLIDCLRREVQEELGVIPRWFYELPQGEVSISPLGRIMHPFVVTDWGDTHLPEKILDNGHPIFWEELDNVLNSPIPSVKKIAEDLKSYLQK